MIGKKPVRAKNASAPALPVRLLRMAAVIDSTGLSRSAVYRMMDNGEFPLPVNIGPRAVAWRSDVIERWIADRIKNFSQGHK